VHRLRIAVAHAGGRLSLSRNDLQTNGTLLLVRGLGPGFADAPALNRGPDLAKEQMGLLLRATYLHPGGHSPLPMIGRQFRSESTSYYFRLEDQIPLISTLGPFM
jgi:hypothetical protein